MKTGIRIVAWLAGLAVLGGLAVALSVSWWLPWLLPRALAQAGVLAGPVLRQPDGGMRIATLVWESAAAEVRLSDVSLPPPDAFLLHGFRQSKWGQTLESKWGQTLAPESKWGQTLAPDRGQGPLTVRAGRVEVRLLEGGAEPPSEGPGPPELAGLIREAMAGYARWLPDIVLGELTVEAENGDRHLSALGVVFSEWHLSARVRVLEIPGEMELVASLSPWAAWDLRIMEPVEGIRAWLAVQAEETSLVLDAVLDRGGDEIRGRAVIGSDGWLPREATVQSAGFRLEPGWLPEWGRHYAAEVTALDLEWDGDSYAGAVELRGEATLPEGGTVPLKARAVINGDRHRVQVDTFSLATEWLTAQLSDPLAVEFHDWAVDGPTRLTFDADLDRQQIIAATGRVSGSAAVSAEDDGDPLIDFELESAALSHGDWTLEAISATGTLAGKTLTVSQLHALLPDRGLEFTASGDLLLGTGTLSVEATLGRSGGVSQDGESVDLAKIHADYSGSGGLQLVARNVGPDLLGALTGMELPALRVDSLTLDLVRLEPDLEGQALVRAVFAPDGQPGVVLTLDGRFTGDGLRIQEVAVAFMGETVLAGQLAIPVILSPLAGAESGQWRLLGTGVLEGQLAGAAGPAFSAWLEEQSDIRLSGARIDLELAGTFQHPEAHLAVAADAIDLRALTDTRQIPELRDLSLLAHAGSDLFTVEQLALEVNDSAVRGHGQIPYPVLRDALLEKPADWKAVLAAAAGELHLDGWRTGDWAALIPAILRPTGLLDGQVVLSPGLDVTGNLVFEDFALRPTLAFASIDRIHGRVEFAGQDVRLVDGGALVGGNPIKVLGQLSRAGPDKSQWEITATGENIPLVRTPEMILRSDLDLRFTDGGPGGSPLLGGSLNLRPSTLLMNFDPLAPGVRSGPARKPPWFSLPDPLYGAWRFDLAISGDRFLRVRSPYFAATVSADLDLGGTFAEPLLLGAARIDSGELRFPGAKLLLTRGEAFIEPGRPDEVQLDMTGVARKASHIVTVDITNTLSEPHVNFQSTPQLPNSSIIRLLTTGSTAGGGLGTVGLYLGQGLLGPGALQEGFAERLSFDIGHETTRSGLNTIGVRFDLGGSVYLQGEYDVFDEYNLDLVWRLYQR